MSEPATATHDFPGCRINRFVIKERLGGGGMGEVFLAEDSLLRRQVAIKAIRREHSQDPEFRHRLHREAERASQLNDEHIARIYDLVEENGRLFLIMEYVKGETLRSRMLAPLAPPEFFNIAEQVLSGLAAAHRQGILHCDLKPENLMITSDGVLKILDFGLARQLETEDATCTVTMTSASVGGTLGYMAPEVLLGIAPSERSDIFSAGVVFYQAFTGCHPFRTGQEIATANLISPDQPSPLEREAPSGLGRVLARMLAKEPAQRYQSCDEVLADLRAVRDRRKPLLGRARLLRNKLPLRGAVSLIAVAVLGVLLLPNLPWRTPWQAAPVNASSRQLVVLPFEAASKEANSRAFANGLTEALAAKLGQIADRYPLEIIPASEVRAQGVTDARQARTSLGATIVLEGSLQQSGNTVRVIYSLVDTRSLRQMNSGVITANTADPFAVQDRVIEEVLGHLDIELAKQDRGRMAAHGTGQAQAYEHYLRGRGYLQAYDRTESLDASIAEFGRSLAADPFFALAYAGLGQAYLHRYDITHLPQSLEAARTACVRAAEMDNGPDGNICLGMLFNATGQHEKAAEHLQSALKADTSRDETYLQLAVAYEGLQRVADAESLLKKAVALRPQYWAVHKWLGRFYFDRGRYDEASEQFRLVIKLAPDSFGGYSNLGGVYINQGKYAEAIEALERSIHIQPTAAALNNVGALYFYQRKYAESARSYELAAQMTPDDYLIFGNLGEVYAQMAGKQQESRRNYAQALKLAEQRLNANSNDSAALLQAALYAAMLGQGTKAEEYRKSGIGLSANNPQARFNSALVLAQLHEDGRALAELDRALSAGLPASEVTDNPAWQRFAGNQRFEAVMARAQNKR